MYIQVKEDVCNVKNEQEIIKRAKCYQKKNEKVRNNSVVRINIRICRH